MVEELWQVDWQGILAAFDVVLIQLALSAIVYVIVKAVGLKLVQKSFSRLTKTNKISQGRAVTLEKLAKRSLQVVLFFILIVVWFEILGFSVAGLIAAAGIVGLAIGFGAQGLVSDVVTGFFLLIEKWLDVGDVVEVAGFSGVVEELGLKTTLVRGFDGTLHYIPNREITTLSNKSRGNMQTLIDIGISYNDDIDRATAVIQSVCDRLGEEDENIVEAPKVLGVQALGSSEVVLRVIGQAKNGEQYGVERKLRQAIKEALDENGIEIPYPHQVYISKTAE